jgi:methionyl-tRNA formyltransferase
MSRLRVFVITEDDPLYVSKFFEVFLRDLPRDRIELVGMTISRAFHEPIWKTARRIHRFYGTLDFFRLGLRYALAKVRRSGIGRLARRMGVPLHETASVNAVNFVERLRDLRVDVLVSVAAPEVFKRPLLQVARLGCINIHSGRLPKYRGMMPTFWQMRHGEREVVVTIHEMAEKLDAGGVFVTRSFALRERDVLDRVIIETKREGARCMLEVLADTAERGSLPKAVPLDMTQADYYRFPDPENVRAFRARGHRLL